MTFKNYLTIIKKLSKILLIALSNHNRLEIQLIISSIQ